MEEIRRRPPRASPRHTSLLPRGGGGRRPDEGAIPGHVRTPAPTPPSPRRGEGDRLALPRGARPFGGQSRMSATQERGRSGPGSILTPCASRSPQPGAAGRTTATRRSGHVSAITPPGGSGSLPGASSAPGSWRRRAGRPASRASPRPPTPDRPSIAVSRNACQFLGLTRFSTRRIASSSISPSKAPSHLPLQVGDRFGRLGQPRGLSSPCSLRHVDGRA